MRYSTAITLFVALFLGFLQLAFATEDPEIVIETVHSTSTKIALVTKTGVAPLAEATANSPGRVIKVFTIAPENAPAQVLAVINNTNGTATRTTSPTGVPYGNSTTTTISTPTTSPTQDDEKESSGAMQMASLPLLVSVVVAALGAIAL